MGILPETSYQKIYTGSSIKAKFLQNLLEDQDIKVILRNDEESARASGYAIDYANGMKILVHKDDLLKAKHIVDNALDEKGDVIAISEEELERQALNNTKERSLKSDRSPNGYRRSPFNLALNFGIILYSLWRLSPLLKGEELPMWRIVLSSLLILFCAWTLISHFKTTASK